jgi:hypothetical protein
MDMERYWSLVDLWTAREKKAAWKLTYHEQHQRDTYVRPNKHDRLAGILIGVHGALVTAWAAYHFSSWPPETVRRLEKDLAEWKRYCEIYGPLPRNGEQIGTRIIERALAQFKSVLDKEGA